MEKRKPKGLRSPAEPVLPGNDALAGLREESIEVLTECFARDVIAIDDFERRTGQVHGARSIADLQAALDGIPTASPSAHPQPHTAATPAHPGLPARLATPPAQVPSSERSVAIFGETRREGVWIPARRNTAVAVMGSAVLDLREARLGEERTVIAALTLMGSVEVIVPPDVHVECNGSAVFGGFEQRREVNERIVPGAPVVRVEGWAILGSVEVERRLVGESRREAKRRRKRTKRERKRERREARKRRGPGGRG